MLKKHPTKALLFVYTLMVLLFSACGPRYGDFCPCHDDGTPKPRVVLLPIKSAPGLCERADELMQNIRYNLMDRGNLYLYPEEIVKRQLEKMGDVSFFDSDVSFAWQFGGADFVVASELVECRSDLYGNVEDKCMPPHLQRKNLLMVKLRVRVIDLRCHEPVIVLQEMLSRDLLVPNRKFGESEVDLSCFSEISCRLADDFARRLENGISLR